MMNNALQYNLIRPKGLTTAVGRILFGMMLAAGAATAVHAQGLIASGTVSGSGSGPYTYDLSFSDAPSSTSPVGSVWYAWVPGAFYLPGTPTGVSAPAGWSATIFANSIQFAATPLANAITPGSTLSGFSYQAAFTPAELAAAANSGLSVAYSGGIESGASFTFTVQAVPEPSKLVLFVCGAAGFCVLRRRRVRAA